MEKLLNFLAELRTRHIYFQLAASRPDTIMVRIVVPGERWEVEFFENGEVDVEVFRSRSGVEGEEAIQELFDRFTD